MEIALNKLVARYVRTVVRVVAPSHLEHNFGGTNAESDLAGGKNQALKIIGECHWDSLWGQFQPSSLVEK